MSNTYKRLGATVVTASTPTTLYTVPAATMTVVGLIHACNIGTSERTFRIAIVDGAIGGVSNEDYLYYDCSIGPNTGLSFNIGVSLPATYTILVYASHADVVFSAFGVEMA
jgi:hypothetical protein